MSGLTTRWQIPYPILPDPADAKVAIQNVANSLDDIAKEFAGLFSARPAAAIKGKYYFATDQGILYRDNGASWDTMTRPGGGIPGMDSSLFPPSNPYDGQEIYVNVLQPQVGYCWHLRYKASNGYWYVIGAPELGSENSSNSNTTSTSYVSLGTPPSLAVPLSGDYLVGIGCWGTPQYASQVFMSITDGVNAAVDADAVISKNWSSDRIAHTRSARWMKRTLVGGRTISCQYRGDNGQSAVFSQRWLRLIPIRVH